MSAFADSTGSMGMPASRWRFSNSSRSNGLATATTSRPAAVRSSGSSACFCAKGRDTVRVASAMSSLSGSIFRYGMPAARAAASVTRSSSSTSPAVRQRHLERRDDLHRRHVVARRLLGAALRLRLEHARAGRRLAREDLLGLLRT